MGAIFAREPADGWMTEPARVTIVDAKRSRRETSPIRERERESLKRASEIDRWGDNNLYLYVCLLGSQIAPPPPAQAANPIQFAAVAVLEPKS